MSVWSSTARGARRDCVDTNCCRIGALPSEYFTKVLLRQHSIGMYGGLPSFVRARLEQDAVETVCFAANP